LAFSELRYQDCARLQVLTAPSVKMTAFWDVAPCSLMEVHRRFRGAYCIIRAMSDHWHGATSLKSVIFVTKFD
jgi:hypothetical protein